MFKQCGGFIGVLERMKTMQIIKRHLMQLQLKLDNLKKSYQKKLACKIKKIIARVFMHMSGVNKTYDTRSDL